MATAEQFDHAAAGLERAHAELLAALEPVRGSWESQPVLAGPLRSEIEGTIATVMQHLSAAAHDVATQAAEARRRAIICRQYAAEVAAYHAARYQYDLDLRQWNHAAAAFDSTSEPNGSRPTRPSFHRSYPLPTQPWIDL